jgi:hypothetical protein
MQPDTGPIREKARPACTRQVPFMCKQLCFDSELKLLQSRLWDANHQSIMKTSANHANPGDEQVGSITC